MVKCITVIFVAVVWFVGSELQAQPVVRQRLSSYEVIRSVFGESLAEKMKDKPIKCATPLVLMIKERWNQLSTETKNIVTSILMDLPTQKSRLSLSGRFRIHYDTTGSKTPALLNSSGQRVEGTYELYIDSVVTFFDYCWTYEVDSLGYTSPPQDGMVGGGPEYDVYVGERAVNDFGQTDLDILIHSSPERYLTSIQIDNDYLGFRTPGMNGLKVTAAHEFHHAMQLGSYGIWNEGGTYRETYFYELTSSWMEDVVYTDVNDYYNDVAIYFTDLRDQNGSLSFNYFSQPDQAGYERCIWGHFLAKKFGCDMMRNIWERIASELVMPSIDDVLKLRGTNFAAEFSDFSYWNYFTADRADTIHYYPEGNHYLRFVPNATTTYLGTTASILSKAHVLSTSFYEFDLTNTTLTAIVTNIDTAAAAQYDASGQALQLKLGTSVTDLPAQALSNGLQIGFGVLDQSKWSVRYLGITPKVSDAAPNPLLLSRDVRLALPVDAPIGSYAHVYFYNSSLSLDHSADYQVGESSGIRMVSVSSATLRSHLSSGIYFVVAKTAKSEYKWKVAVIR